MKKNALGYHLLCELYKCDPEILCDRYLIEKIMFNAAIKAGAEVREVSFHQFNPQGISGVVIISESHLAIHTWPEFAYAAVDLFTCGHSVNPWDAYHYIALQFKAQSATTTEIERGISI